MKIPREVFKCYLLMTCYKKSFKNIQFQNEASLSYKQQVFGSEFYLEIPGISTRTHSHKKRLRNDHVVP